MTGVAVTVGVDVASQPAGTAACLVRWDVTGATLKSVEHDVDDARMATILIEPVAKIGLDVPLGWPRDFVAAVARHHGGRSFGVASTERLARRETDRWVKTETGQLPLSVSTDRIAYPAMRMARLLGQVAGDAVDRTGAGRFVEVYPAAALRVWGMPYRSYKREANRKVLRDVSERLRHRCGWLVADDGTWSDVTHSDHAFDALICALVARAHQRDLCHPIPRDLHAAAAREGWIAVPTRGSLDRLVDVAAAPERYR